VFGAYAQSMLRAPRAREVFRKPESEPERPRVMMIMRVSTDTVEAKIWPIDEETTVCLRPHARRRVSGVCRVSVRYNYATNGTPSCSWRRDYERDWPHACCCCCESCDAANWCGDEQAQEAAPRREVAVLKDRQGQ